MTWPFDRDGYRHELLERDGDACLVRRTNLSTGSVHWEVIRVQHWNAHRGPGDRWVDAGEGYPSTNRWGLDGWTLTTSSDARQKYLWLCLRTGQKGGSLAESDSPVGSEP